MRSDPYASGPFGLVTRAGDVRSVLHDFVVSDQLTAPTLSAIEIRGHLLIGPGRP